MRKSHTSSLFLTLLTCAAFVPSLSMAEELAIDAFPLTVQKHRNDGNISSKNEIAPSSAQGSVLLPLNDGGNVLETASEIHPKPKSAYAPNAAPVTTPRKALSISAYPKAQSSAIVKSPDAPALLPLMPAQEVGVARVVAPSGTSNVPAAESDLVRLYVPSYAGQGQAPQLAYAPQPQPTAYWTANSGESLESVLLNWTQSRGISLNWRTSHDFKVIRPVSNDDSIESALVKLLDQYKGKNTRPIGHLATDPVTGHVSLTIVSG